MQYTLHSGVSEQRLNEYMLYLSRFGYDVTFDTYQNGIRAVEMRNVSVKDCLPVNFRFYYDPKDKSIVTADPACCGEAYETRCRALAQSFRTEMGITKMLNPDVAVKLSGIRIIPSYGVSHAGQPFSREAFMTLVEDYVELPVPTMVLEDNTEAAVIRTKNSAGQMEHSFWLLKLTINSKDKALRLNDLEFCISDDVITSFPYQIAAGIRTMDNMLLLDTLLPDRVEGESELWLAFPSLSPLGGGRMRLYVSLSNERTPLTERLCFGFTVD